MIITSQYRATCKKCGGSISVGEKIEWERARGARHTECPAALENAIRIGGGEGYGHREYRIGQVLREKGKILFVLSASKQYYRADGMSFGVGDESGYIFRALCREATADESAPLLARERLAAEKQVAKMRIREIAEIVKTGTRPDGKNNPDGERILNKQDIYGGGDWFVAAPDKLWYVKNNGMDGDDWSQNNVLTGGAGAIGWFIPFDPALVAELKKIEGYQI